MNGAETPCAIPVSVEEKPGKILFLDEC